MKTSFFSSPRKKPKDSVRRTRSPHASQAQKKTHTNTPMLYSSTEHEQGAGGGGARFTHRLVNNLNDAGLQLGHDRRVTGGDTVLARATRDDHLNEAKKNKSNMEERRRLGVS